MKKTKIVLFTLLLSIMGAIGSTNAASVNNSSRSADLMPSAASQLIQNSSLSKNNIENPNNGKCILWSPRMQNFKKGDQVKILLPNGKYTGKTLTIKIVDHGEQIATLTVGCGCDYGIITFTVDANSGQIAQIVAGFGSMNFRAIGAGGVIDIGGGMTGGCTGNNGSTAPVASAVSYSSSLSNRNDDNLGSSSIEAHSSSIKANSLSSNSRLSKFSRSSSSSDEEDGKAITRSLSSLSLTASRSSRFLSSSSYGKGIIIDYGPGPVLIITPSSESSKSSLSSSHISASSVDKDTHRHPGWCSKKSKSQSKSSSSSSMMKLSSSSLTASSSIVKKLPVSKRSSTSSSLRSRPDNRESSSVISKPSKWVSPSSANEEKHHSRGSVIIVVPFPEPVKENSISINLNHSSSTLKIPVKIDHSSKKLPKVSKKEKHAKSKMHQNAGTKTAPVKAKDNKTKKATPEVKSVKAKNESSKVRVSTEKPAVKSVARQSSRPVVDQNGNLHLNSQQVRALEHKMPKAAKAVKEMSIYETVHGLTARKQIGRAHV